MYYISNLLHIKRYLNILWYPKCVNSYLPSILTQTFVVILPFYVYCQYHTLDVFLCFHSSINYILFVAVISSAINYFARHCHDYYKDSSHMARFFVLEHKLVVHKSINSWCCAKHVHTLAFKCNEIVEFLEYRRITLYK